MKKILFATMLMTSFATLAVQANAQVETTAQQAQETPVKPEELPEAVKTALAGDTYKGWTATAATMVKNGATEYYKIELSKDQEKQTVNLDKDGKAVK